MGPGTILHRMIADWTGEEPNLSCKCNAWIKRMDAKGPAWCRVKLDMIVERLMREASKRANLWRAVPISEDGTLLNALRSRAWKGAFLIPGSKVMLRPFVSAMVMEAIRRSERCTTS